MQSNNSESRPTEITVIVVIIALLILLPPMLDWWGASDRAWYTPYLIWLGIIGMTFGLQRVLRKHAV